MNRRYGSYILKISICITTLFYGAYLITQRSAHANSQTSVVKREETVEQSSAQSVRPQTQGPQQAASDKIYLDVQGQSQEPELYNGCEVTSLSMLLSAAGHPVDKSELADRIVKDSTPFIQDEDGNILQWGDPNDGFVGDITGQDPGYGVSHGPIAQLAASFLPDGAEDFTGSTFADILKTVASGRPVVVWATTEFQPTSARVKWQGPHGPVSATFDEHAVLLVGYDQQYLYINDPLDGAVGKAVDREQFAAAWEQLGKQAVTYKKKT